MITIEIKQDTPEEVMSATAKFILNLRDIIHGDGSQATLPMAGVTASTIEKQTPLPVPAPAKTDEEEEEEGTVDDSELDVRGFPWDSRIHATTKTKLKNGEWKKLRGVEEVLVRQVEAELKQSMTQEEDQELPDVQPATEWPAAPVAPVAPVATGRSYTQLVQLVTEKVTANPDIGAAIQETVRSLGHGSVAELQTQEPEVIGEAYDAIEAL